MKIILILAVSLIYLQANRCDDAITHAVKVCMKYADVNYGYRACLKADNNTTKICGFKGK